MIRKILALTMGFTLLFSMTACSSEKKSSNDAKTSQNSGKVIEINVGYENAVTEPAAKSCEKWKSLVEEKSNGSIKLNLFPNSTLGKKNDLIDQMLVGENVITVADGAFLAEYGVKDFGIFYAPYTFENWDELWKVLDSKWYSELCNELANKGGLRVISSNWIYGARDILSIKPVHVPSDLKGLKMRVSSNDLSTTSFESLGASAIGMDMSDVYQAMSGKTIDAVENPIVSLYNRSFQEVGGYLCKNEHILATSMWICGESFFNTLTEEQQHILKECANEAGLMNNQLYNQATEEAEKGMSDAGVIIYKPTAEEKKEWVAAAQKFFDNASTTMGWSENLYQTVKNNAK